NPEPSLPRGFFVTGTNDYQRSGFDQGHLCPAADRSATQEDMAATFLTTNRVPQSSSLNMGTWASLERYCLQQVPKEGRDLYRIAGPAGRGGWGKEGYRTVLRGANGQIVVPGKCWKVILSVPAGTPDPRKVTSAQARVDAVIMPNQQGLDRDWRTYAVS